MRWPWPVVGFIAVLSLGARAGWANKTAAARTGTLQRSCGPLDGPAFTLHLPAHGRSLALTVVLPGALPHLPLAAPHAVVLGGASGASARGCRAAGKCADAVSGTLTLEALDAAVARGHYRLTFPDGKVARGRFVVRRVKGHVVCG